MPNQELIEYHWNEITEIGEFTYELASLEEPEAFYTTSKSQPLRVTPSREKYFAELRWYLQTQGMERV
jgi:hypothetical protein